MSREFETPRTVIHLFFSFKGRINRAPYWLAGLALYPLAYLAWILFTLVAWPAMIINQGFGVVTMLLFFIAWLTLIVWCYFAITVKRWHDLGFSGWLALIPIIGIVIGFIEGNHAPTRYGKNPLKPYGTINTVERYRFQSKADGNYHQLFNRLVSRAKVEPQTGILLIALIILGCYIIASSVATKGDINRLNARIEKLEMENANLWEPFTVDSPEDEETNPFDGLFSEPEPKDEAYEGLKSFYQSEAFEKLKNDYFFGIKTPERWSPGGWFSYKKEHPEKALQYLEHLASK